MNPRLLYIYGAGGHGKVVADMARLLDYQELVFLDDGAGRPFHADLPHGGVVVAVGSNAVRQQLCERVEAAGFPLVSLIHPSAAVSPDAVIEAGTVVMAQAAVNAGAHIGTAAIINTGAVVEHDCRIGAYAHISPRTALAGNVCVGERTQVGIGSAVIQGISIGADCMIGAGSVVVKPIGDNVLAFGNPARVQRVLPARFQTA